MCSLATARCLVQFTSGHCTALGDEHGTFTSTFTGRLAAGYTLGANTVLCPYGNRYIYLEWEGQAGVHANWTLPDASAATVAQQHVGKKHFQPCQPRADRTRSRYSYNPVEGCTV